MDISLVSPSTDKIRWGYVLGYLMLFLILPPIIGLPIIISMVWKKPNATKSDYYLLFFVVAIYLGAINATKASAGDQINYTWAYLNVPTQGFIGSLKNIYGYKVAMGEAGEEHISGEFMNGVYNYVGYYLTFGYYPLFAALITFADYILLFLGFYKFAQSLKKPHLPIICGVLIISFFYLFFQYTLHIQKQFLAQCIMMYVLGSYAQSGKMTWKLWLITLCSVFTHASTWIFVPFLIYKPLRGRMTSWGLAIVALVVFLFIAYGSNIASEAAEGTGALGYGVQKFAESENDTDDTGGVLVMSQVLVIALPMFLIVFWQLWIRRRKAIDAPQAFILNVVFMLLLSIMAMFNKPIARYRYFMMLIAFMPFVYPYLSANIKTRDFMLKGLSFIMIAWFYFQFERIIWDYAPEWQILAFPPGVLIGLNPWSV